MAGLFPFSAFRPPADHASRVASVPYDVVNSEEAREMVRDNPDSFLRVVKSEVDLAPGTDPYAQTVYAQARANLERLIKDGLLVQDEAPCLYLYTLESGNHRQTGLVATFSVEEYLAGSIRRHELTRKEKEDDRVRHIEALNAQSGPVLLTFMADQNIARIVDEQLQLAPHTEYTAEDGVRHSVHVVSDSAVIGQLQQAFTAINLLFIADGHHRSAAAARIYEEHRNRDDTQCEAAPWCRFLGVAFPHDQLRILPYNRVVVFPPELDRERFLHQLAARFYVEKTDCSDPPDHATFCMYLKGEWYLLRFAGAPPRDPLKALDVSLLQDEILVPLLAIDDPRTDKRIDFVGGIRGCGELEKLVDSGRYDVAFSMYPTSILELINVAGECRIMPPKSTWFEPKLRSGLFIHSLDSRS